MVAYTVHRVADTQAQVARAKMPDGRVVNGALIPALEIELVTADGLNSSVTLRFVGDDIEIAKSLYFQGASITGTFASA